MDLKQAPCIAAETLGRGLPILPKNGRDLSREESEHEHEHLLLMEIADLDIANVSAERQLKSDGRQIWPGLAFDANSSKPSTNGSNLAWESMFKRLADSFVDDKYV